MIVTAAVMMLAVTALCMIPSASASEDRINTYTDIRAESHIVGVGLSVTYTLHASYEGTENILFQARLVDWNGNSVGSVSPSTGVVERDGRNININAPSDPGLYILTVDFTFANGDNEVIVTKTAPVKVVTPIILSATLVNEGGELVELDVWFIVNGVKIEESEQQIDIAAGQTRVVTYSWVTESLGHGMHHISMGAEIGILEDFLNVSVSSFYVGQSNYSFIETVMIIIFLVLLIILVVIYRKPVKNLGKPKGRR